MITFDDNVLTIPKQSFYNRKLLTISLPASGTTLADQAFRACCSLKVISISTSVIDVVYYVFRDAVALKDLIVNMHHLMVNA